MLNIFRKYFSSVIIVSLGMGPQNSSCGHSGSGAYSYFYQCSLKVFINVKKNSSWKYALKNWDRYKIPTVNEDVYSGQGSSRNQMVHTRRDRNSGLVLKICSTASWSSEERKEGGRGCVGGKFTLKVFILLTLWFPCQSLSLAKSNGRQRQLS